MGGKINCIITLKTCARKMLPWCCVSIENQYAQLFINFPDLGWYTIVGFSKYVHNKQHDWPISKVHKYISPYWSFYQYPHLLTLHTKTHC